MKNDLTTTMEQVEAVRLSAETTPTTRAALTAAYHAAGAAMVEHVRTLPGFRSDFYYAPNPGLTGQSLEVFCAVVSGPDGAASPELGDRLRTISTGIMLDALYAATAPPPGAVVHRIVRDADGMIRDIIRYATPMEDAP